MAYCFLLRVYLSTLVDCISSFLTYTLLYVLWTIPFVSPDQRGYAGALGGRRCELVYGFHAIK